MPQVCLPLPTTVRGHGNSLLNVGVGAWSIYEARVGPR